MNPRIKEVKPLPDYRLDLTFASGEVGVYDCRQLLEFGVFREHRSRRGSAGKRQAVRKPQIAEYRTAV